MQQVSEAYLLGIREGRQLLSAVMASDPGDPGFWREYMASLARPMPGFSGDMAQFIKGQRDFARNWLKKGIGQ